MKNILFLFIPLSIWSSCVVSKPDSSSITAPDYNSRVQVGGAHYKHRASLLGIGAVAAGTAAGGYLGYRQEWTVRQDGEIRQPIHALNIGLGALAGFAVTNLSLHLMGKNKETESRDALKWLKKANPGYVLYQKSSETHFIAIPGNADGNYSVRSFDDTQGFFRCFPNSPRKEEIFEKSLGVIQRPELPALIALYPNGRHVAAAKLRYYELSPTIEALLEAQQRFPEVAFPLEQQAAERCKTLTDVEIFRGKFGTESRYNDYIFEKLYPSLGFADLLRLLDYFPNAASVIPAKTLAIRKCPDLPSLERLKNKWYPEFKTEMQDKGAALALENAVDFPSKLDRYAWLFPESPWLHTSGDTLYLGHWKNGMPNGNGLRKSGGKTYEYGFFAVGKLHGDYGKQIYDATQTYEGGFRHGQYHGKGKVWYHNGSWYEGDFLFGDRHGKGKACGPETQRYFALNCQCSGGCYEGDWLEDYPDGYGKWTSDDGETWYEGYYRDGRFEGQGQLRIPPGLRISGNFKNGSPNGNIILKKWTLAGLISEQETVYANNWEAILPGVERLEEKWANTFSSDKSPETHEPGAGTPSSTPEEEETIDYEKIERPGIAEVGEWHVSPHSQDFRQYIRFDDGTTGYVFEDDDGYGYHISSGSTDWYYLTYEAALRALYVYKKYNVVIKRDSKK